MLFQSTELQRLHAFAAWVRERKPGEVFSYFGNNCGVCQFSGLPIADWTPAENELNELAHAAMSEHRHGLTPFTRLLKHIEWKIEALTAVS